MAAPAWIAELDTPPPAAAARRIVHILLGGDPRAVRPRDGAHCQEAGRDPLTPGKGGRRPRVDRSYLTEQTRELIDELGEPLVARSYQATTNIWELDPAGDGVLAARLSANAAAKPPSARFMRCARWPSGKGCALATSWSASG